MRFKIKRRFTGNATYLRFDIARGQLETAIRLFLADDSDMFSVIALAANSGELFHSLVIQSGRKSNVDEIASVFGELTGQTPSRKDLIYNLHKIYSVNQMKHYDPKDQDPFIELDAESCAYTLLDKAIADYETVAGTPTPITRAFRHWVSTNHDIEAEIEDSERDVEELRKRLAAERESINRPD